MISKLKILYNHKKRLPVSHISSLVYKFRRASYDATYVGSTRKLLICRVQQHVGLSFQTNLPLSTPEDSSIRSHCHICCMNQIGMQNFKTPDCETMDHQLRLLESKYIN